MKYTILIPGSEINEEQLLALRGEDSYFYGNVNLPEGAFILVPENEREILQRDNPEMQIIGYEGEPRDYGTAILSSMGYKAERISNEKRGWKNDEDINKVYEIARAKGKSTLQHCYSKEICEEDRGYAINYLLSLFKIIQAKIKENPNFANVILEEEGLLNVIKDKFILCVIKGQSSSENGYLNENRCETEGIEELLENFSENGFEFSEEQSKTMRETFTRERYDSAIEFIGDTTLGNKFFSDNFFRQMVTAIEQNISKGKEMANQVPKRTESNNLLGSAIQATEQTTRSGTIGEQKNKIIQLQKTRVQAFDNKDMNKE